MSVLLVSDVVSCVTFGIAFLVVLQRSVNSSNASYSDVMRALLVKHVPPLPTENDALVNETCEADERKAEVREAETKPQRMVLDGGIRALKHRVASCAASIPPWGWLLGIGMSDSAASMAENYPAVSLTVVTQCLLRMAEPVLCYVLVLLIANSTTTRQDEHQQLHPPQHRSGGGYCVSRTGVAQFAPSPQCLWSSVVSTCTLCWARILRLHIQKEKCRKSPSTAPARCLEHCTGRVRGSTVLYLNMVQAPVEAYVGRHGAFLSLLSAFWFDSIVSFVMTSLIAPFLEITPGIGPSHQLSHVGPDTKHSIARLVTQSVMAAAVLTNVGWMLSYVGDIVVNRVSAPLNSMIASTHCTSGCDDYSRVSFLGSIPEAADTRRWGDRPPAWGGDRGGGVRHSGCRPLRCCPADLVNIPAGVNR